MQQGELAYYVFDLAMDGWIRSHLIASYRKKENSPADNSGK